MGSIEVKSGSTYVKQTIDPNQNTHGHMVRHIDLSHVP